MDSTINTNYVSGDNTLMFVDHYHPESNQFSEESSPSPVTENDDAEHIVDGAESLHENDFGISSNFGTRCHNIGMTECSTFEQW